MSTPHSKYGLSIEDSNIVTRLLDETRRAIHSDYERAPSQFRAFLLFLEREIFNHDLSISKARGVSKLRSNNYATTFRRLIGSGPRDYVKHHRITAAQKIIQYTSIRHWQVAEIVGFSDPAVFSRTYKRLLGHSPRDEHKAMISEIPCNSDHNLGDPDNDQRDSKALDPRVSENTAELSLTARISGLEEFWSEINLMNSSEIKNYIWNSAEAIEIRHFHYLLEKAKHEGRRDRERGEELHVAALDLLRLVEFCEGREFPNEKSLGYARLGNACKLRLKLEDAGRCFRRAEELLPRNLQEKPLLVAQVYYLKASLLWWRRDTEAAISLLKTILPNIREYAPRCLLARVLLQLGEIYDSTGHTDLALPLLREANELTHLIDDTFVIFSANFNLTLVYTKVSMAREANAQLQEVYKYLHCVPGTMSSCYLSWLEGAVSRVNKDFRKAELHFSEARQAFLNAGLDVYAALVSLDLSLLSLEMKRPKKAFASAVSAIPTISRFGAHQEAIAALAILQEAQTLQRIDKAGVEKALYHLELVRKDPTSNFLPR